MKNKSEEDEFHLFHHLKLVKAVKSKLRWLMSTLDQHLNYDHQLNFMIRPFIDDDSSDEV